MLKQDIESEVVAGYAPSRPMRSDSAPFNAPKPRSSRGHRPHGKPQGQAPRHAHAGPKQHRGGAGNGGNARTGGRRDSRA
jgi:ATP-dependent RNA helicase RhlE